ncbi:hypothetical protein K461DRAFT_249394 [Myriangium duriaei CBS 260.36]|uniref:J domain-containing protein n=1 Tax=Myriangium duriaei CBS 260.36 TaxID=1168546 RepID=A0A9P4MP36_9PEZI|nr:hypothetical protein K461DRAFT_249394 [Myriangium duriaei CBS 260.36]
MKLFGSIILVLATFLTVAAAWSTEDHEIFRVRDEVTLHEGDNATFYSFLGVKPSATLDDINRAWRKQSRLLHPDKARANWLTNYDKAPRVKTSDKRKPGVNVHKHKKPSQREIKNFNKEASARYARLGVVTNILRGPERERYDHFLRNGFPKWRGTGYYYQRFRPGLGSVLFGLFVFVGGGFHYLALYIGWKKQREFVERYIRHARRMAWGDDSSIGAIPGLSAASSGAATPMESEDEPAAQQWNRREKRAMAKEKKRDAKNPRKMAAAAAKAKESGISTPQEAQMTSGPVGAKKRTVAENGKILIVDSAGNVWLEEETEEGDVQEFLLDPNEIARPTIYDTVLFKLPQWAYYKSASKFLNKPEADLALEQLESSNEKSSEDQAVEAATAINANGEARKRKAKIAKRRPDGRLIE